MSNIKLFLLSDKFLCLSVYTNDVHAFAQFVGIVRYQYILQNVAKEFNINIAKITESPMKRLVDYYYPKLLQ